MSVWIWVWLGVLVASLIIEFISMELVSIWVSVGSLFSLILAACGVGYEIQIIVCIILSIACILLLRKVTLKFLNRNKDATNLDRIVNTKAKLLSDITNDNSGTIKVNGVVWNVVSENGESIAKDSYVEILRVEGNKFIVRKGE